MRAAPAVDAALADGRAERAAVLGLHLMAAVVLIAWLADWFDLWRHAMPWPQFAPWALAALAVAGLTAASVLGHVQARRWLPCRPRRLRWTGQAWDCIDAGRPEALSAVCVQIDLGPWLLLRLQPQAPAAQRAWAVARAEVAGADWHALRVALRQHAGRATPAAGDLGPTGA